MAFKKCMAVFDMLKLNRCIGMKNVMFINASLTDGGSERVMTLLANQLALSGNYMIKMLVLRDKEKTYLVSNDVNVVQFHDMNKNKLIKIFGRILGIRKNMKDFDGEFIIAFMDEIAFLTIVASLGLKKKVIISIRNNPKRKDKKVIRLISRVFTLPLAYKVVFQTPQAKACYSKKIQNKSYIIPNPINKNLPSDVEYNFNNKMVIAIGRLEAQKNYEMAVKAFKKFNVLFPDYKMYIYGKGTEKDKIQNLINDLHMEEKIKLKGFVNNIFEELSKASIFISTSNFEGISNTMLEAMAMGIPTICTNCPIGGAAYVIENYKNGILISVGDVEQMAKELEMIAQNKEFALKLSENARKVNVTYSIEQISKMWTDILN